MWRKIVNVVKDVIAWLLLIAVLVAVLLLIAWCDRVLDDRDEARATCREHGYLGATLYHGEWVCDGLEDGRAVRVLLSEVEANKGQ